MNLMPLIHIVSMQSTQFLHSMNSFDPSISLNTETISFNTIDSFYYRFCPFSFRRKTGNSETPNGMCQNNNLKNVRRRNRFSNLYICTCAAVLFVSLFSRFASACWETLHWTPPFVTSFLSSVMCVCVCFFHPCFVWQTTSFHAFILLKSDIIDSWIPCILLWREENEPLLFDLFRLRLRLLRLFHVYFIIPLFFAL